MFLRFVIMVTLVQAFPNSAAALSEANTEPTATVQEVQYDPERLEIVTSVRYSWTYQGTTVMRFFRLTMPLHLDERRHRLDPWTLPVRLPTRATAGESMIISLRQRDQRGAWHEALPVDHPFLPVPVAPGERVEVEITVKHLLPIRYGPYGATRGYAARTDGGWTGRPEGAGVPDWFAWTIDEGAPIAGVVPDRWVGREIWWVEYDDAHVSPAGAFSIRGQFRGVNADTRMNRLEQVLRQAEAIFVDRVGQIRNPIVVRILPLREHLSHRVGNEVWVSDHAFVRPGPRPFEEIHLAREAVAGLLAQHAVGADVDPVIRDGTIDGIAWVWTQHLWDNTIRDRAQRYPTPRGSEPGAPFVRYQVTASSLPPPSSPCDSFPLPEETADLMPHLGCSARQSSVMMGSPDVPFHAITERPDWSTFEDWYRTYGATQVPQRDKLNIAVGRPTATASGWRYPLAGQAEYAVSWLARGRNGQTFAGTVPPGGQAILIEGAKVAPHISLDPDGIHHTDSRAGLSWPRAVTSVLEDIGASWDSESRIPELWGTMSIGAAQRPNRRAQFRLLIDRRLVAVLAAPEYQWGQRRSYRGRANAIRFPIDLTLPWRDVRIDERIGLGVVANSQARPADPVSIAFGVELDHDTRRHTDFETRATRARIRGSAVLTPNSDLAFVPILDAELLSIISPHPDHQMAGRLSTTVVLGDGPLPTAEFPALGGSGISRLASRYQVRSGSVIRGQLEWRHAFARGWDVPLLLGRGTGLEGVAFGEAGYLGGRYYAPATSQPVRAIIGYGVRLRFDLGGAFPVLLGLDLGWDLFTSSGFHPQPAPHLFIAFNQGL